MADAMVRGVNEGRRIRMAPDDRERMILEEAVRFFARHGFSAQIREFASEAGISQGLVYRYFRSKRELVERVYEHNFIKRWDAQWEAALQDRTEPLDRRLCAFYSAYLKAIDDPDWIRLVMYSGLEGNDLAPRYVRTQVEHLLKIIATECRDPGSAEAASAPVTEAEMEAVWHLHSTFIYYLVRKHIFGVRTIEETDMLVTVAVNNFLGGIGGLATDMYSEPSEERKSQRRIAGQPRAHASAKRRMNGNGRWIDE
jgi:AcrR family transcriptional regulator